jgi:type I restriction enzyme, S subunit
LSQEEIVVPKGWELKKLADICEKISSGGTPSRGNSEYFGGDIPWLKIGDLNEGEITDSKEKITKSGLENSSAKLFPENTVLFAMYGATIGKTGILKKECSTNQAICGMVPGEKILPTFLLLLLQSKFYQIRKMAEGGAQPNINQEKLKNLEILLPPISTQKQIVAKLDHILGELDTKKKEIISLIEQNKERIDFFEKNWMSYVIDREIENHPQRKEWKLKELNQLNNIISGNAFKSTEFTKSGIPVITISNVGHGLFIDKFEKFLPIEFEKKYSQYLVKSNYILLALTRPFTDNNRLKVCKTSNLKNSLLNQRVAMIIPFDNIDVNFLLNAMQTTSFKKQTTENLSTSLQPNLSSTKLPLMTIPNPPISTQKEIVKNIKSAEEKFQTQKKKFENIKNNYESKINYINHIQSSVLDSAFSGKLLN